MAIRVLLIDDRTDFCREFLNRYSEEDWIIETSYNGKDGLDKIKKSVTATPFHVIFLDIAMPGFDGFDVLAGLESAGLLDSFYIVVITGEVIIDKAVEVLSLGADYFLDKRDIMNKPALVEALAAKGHTWQSLRRGKALAQKEQEELALCIAHEMGNYSSIVSGATRNLRSHVEDDDAGLEEINCITDALSRIELLSQGLLGLRAALAIKESDKRNVDVKNVIERTIDYYKRATSELELIIDIEKDFTEEIPKVWGSDRALEGVFMNLISNAVKAMPKGGVLKISAEYYPPKHVIITIADTGVGIRPEKLNTIWEVGKPDWSPELGIEGTGFGLPVCQKTVEAHKGTINIESKFNEGTTVTVRLPIASSEDKRSAER